MTTARRIARRPGQVVVGNGARRRRLWETLGHAATIANGAQTFVDLLQNIPDTEQMGLTVTRLLFDMWFTPDVGTGADGAQMVDVGIGLVSEEAFNAGILPDPNQNADQPVTGWLFKARTVVQVMVSPDAVLGGHMQVDLRAQRKMGQRAKLVLIMNNTAVVSTSFNVRNTGMTRVLCLLP